MYCVVWHVYKQTCIVLCGIRAPHILLFSLDYLLPLIFHLHSAIIRSADNPSPVGTEANAVDNVCVALVCLNASFALDIPDLLMLKNKNGAIKMR